MEVTKTSKCVAVMEAKGEFVPWEFDLRPLGPNDIEIKVTHCGVCRSDLHSVDGDWGETALPAVVGHEIIGYVTEVGPDVKKFKVGQRVGVGPQALSCLDCRQCSKHLENYCLDKIMTYGDMHLDGYITRGGYAEFHRSHEHFCFPIPDALPSAECAPLLCAGITVWSPLIKWKVGKGTRVGVIGVGGLGHLAIQYAAALGAEVTAISTSANKRDEVKKFGAKDLLVSTDAQQMRKASGTFDFLLNTASAETDWDKWLKLLDVDGTLCNLGVPPDSFNAKVPPFSLVGRRINITGSLIGSPDEFEPMLEFSAKHKILPMIETVPLEKVNDIAEKVRKNQCRYRGVLVIDDKYKPSK